MQSNFKIINKRQLFELDLKNYEDHTHACDVKIDILNST